MNYVIRYTSYKRTHLLNDEFVDINDAESFIDSNWIGKDKSFIRLRRKANGIHIIYNRQREDERLQDIN